jgi:hypothetical protein
LKTNEITKAQAEAMVNKTVLQVKDAFKNTIFVEGNNA